MTLYKQSQKDVYVMVLNSVQLGFFNQCYAHLYTVLPIAISLVKTVGFAPNDLAKPMNFFTSLSACRSK